MFLRFNQLAQYFPEMSGLPSFPAPLDDGLSLLQGASLPYLMPSAYSFLGPPTSTANLTHNFIDSSIPTSSYGHHHHQQQQYLDTSLLLPSQPLLRPGSLHHLPSLVQPNLPLSLNYLNFSLLNSLGPLQAQGIKVKGAILRIISK